MPRKTLDACDEAVVRFLRHVPDWLPSSSRDAILPLDTCHIAEILDAAASPTFRLLARMAEEGKIGRISSTNLGTTKWTHAKEAS